MKRRHGSKFGRRHVRSMKPLRLAPAKWCHVRIRGIRGEFILPRLRGPVQRFIDTAFRWLHSYDDKDVIPDHIRRELQETASWIRDTHKDYTYLGRVA